MAVLHISESELARNTRSVLDQLEAGVEIVIERNAKPVAVLRATEPRRRKLSEIIASLPENSMATVDNDFAADVQDFIERHREPLGASKWD
jgi:antitoxin (DNA-binding transcriptional repressor) of toxin-antitoxin stability system